MGRGNWWGPWAFKELDMTEQLRHFAIAFDFPYQRPYFVTQ